MTVINQDVLVELVRDKLNSLKSELYKFFIDSKKIVGTRHCFIDDLLPLDVAVSISNSFPHYEKMRHMDSFRENKYTSKSFEKFNPILKDMTFAIQDKEVISIVNGITGIKDQISDPTLYAGGLSMMPKGCFLNPHIDNSHDGGREHYRTLNLLYYASRNWNEEFGGNLELWDKSVKHKVTIVSKFNRLVLMETNPWSWHSVNKVLVDQSRNCISNYYFSKNSPIENEYFNVTSYSARPEEWTKALLFKSDNFVRSSLRYFFPTGLGKKDVFSSIKK